jgi:hypothetical protein
MVSEHLQLSLMAQVVDEMHTNEQGCSHTTQYGKQQSLTSSVDDHVAGVVDALEQSLLALLVRLPLVNAARVGLSALNCHPVSQNELIAHELPCLWGVHAADKPVHLSVVHDLAL